MSLKLESEPKPDAAVGAARRRWHVRAGVGGLTDAAGVLVDDRDRVVIAAVLVAAAELDSLRGVGKGELVGHVLLQRHHGVDRADVGFRVNVVGAEVDAARLRERQVQFELADTHG